VPLDVPPKSRFCVRHEVDVRAMTVLPAAGLERRSLAASVTDVPW
jgi:hypothetical protein